MSMKDILNITIKEAEEVYKNMGLSFIIKDGKLKGMQKEVKHEN